MIKLFDNKMNEIHIDFNMYQWQLFPLDNYSSFGFMMDNKYFQTSEHAFQYLKFEKTNINIANKIRESYSPNDARNIAHENKIYKLKNWSEIKYKNMEKVLRLKVNQNPIVKQCLLNTNNYIIAECCVDYDTDWGVNSDNQGNNNLGKIWMKIRDEIKQTDKMIFICKVATREELIKRWKYLINIHQNKKEWEQYKENAIRNFDAGSTISYLGFLNNRIICEATAYIKESAFIGDINEPSGLLNENMAYLAAFRTNHEYEGKGYFGKLYKFVEDDLRKRGYSELSLGVGPEAVRNIEIYFHLGFKDYIKTVTQNKQFNEGSLKQVEDVILFYKKKI